MFNRKLKKQIVKLQSDISCLEKKNVDLFSDMAKLFIDMNNKQLTLRSINFLHKMNINHEDVKF